MRRLSAFLTFLLLARFVQAATFYIDPTFSGVARDGSLERPFKSWSEAQPKMTDNNVICINRGTTLVAPNFVIGNNISNFTLQDYGNSIERPILLATSLNNRSKALDFNGRLSNVTIRNIEITTETGLLTSLVDIDHSANGIKFKGCKFHNAQWGIRIRSYEPAPYDMVFDLTIEDCLITNTKDDGVYLYKVSGILFLDPEISRSNQKWYPGASQDYAAGDNLQSILCNKQKYVRCKFSREGTGNKFNVIISGNTPVSGDYLIFEGCEFRMPISTDQGGAAIFIGQYRGNIDFNFNEVYGDRGGESLGLSGLWYQATSGNLVSNSNLYNRCRRAISHLNPSGTRAESKDDVFRLNESEYPSSVTALSPIIIR
ncbi:MAG: hypothetical protein FD166_2806 [Bacteroidetes bacterium]|nr:MAG: hypothetical protein FD166_2806 [Bacteroidota bacterium]